MSDKAEGFVVGLIMGLIVAWFAFVECSDAWMKEIVKQGHAEYSQTTGQWQWKEVAK